MREVDAAKSDSPFPRCDNPFPPFIMGRVNLRCDLIDQAEHVGGEHRDGRRWFAGPLTSSAQIRGRNRRNTHLKIRYRREPIV